MAKFNTYEVYLNSGFKGEFTTKRPHEALDLSIRTLKKEGFDTTHIGTAKTINSITGETLHYNVYTDHCGVSHYMRQ